MDRITECANNVRSFLMNSYLDGLYKEKVHITHVLLVALLMILWDTRIAVKPESMPTSRADTVGIVMAGVPLLQRLHLLSFARASNTHCHHLRNIRKDTPSSIS